MSDDAEQQHNLPVPPPPPPGGPPPKKIGESASTTQLEFDEFTQTKDRTCTDILCCCTFLFFILGWAGVVALGVMFGSPYSLVYAVDYETNICNYQCSKSAEYCPGNLVGGRRVGHFPRIVSDLMEQSSEISQGNLPKFYTICQTKCPKKGDIICKYSYEKKYNGIVSIAQIKQCLSATASVNRFVYSQAPQVLDMALAGANVPNKDFCAETYHACDWTTTDTAEVLNRCLPVSIQAAENITERCTFPLSTAVCDPVDLSNARSGKFTTNCIRSADDGEYYKALYRPTVNNFPTYTQILLEGDAKDNCASKEVYTENMKEEMPQDDQLKPILDAAMTAMSYFADVIKSYKVILVMGFAAPLVLSSLWIGILRFFTAPLVWGTLIALDMCSLGGGLFFLIQAGVIDVNEVTSQASAASGAAIEVSVPTLSTPYNGYFEAVGYILCACAAILLCLMIFQRQAIKTAINVIKLTAAALGAMPQLQLFPLLTYGALCCLLVLWIIVLLLLTTASSISMEDIQGTLANATATAGGLGLEISANISVTSNNVTAPGGIATLEGMKAVDYLYAYHLFGLLWMNSFLQGIGMMTIAGSVSCWYWAPFEITTADTSAGDGSGKKGCCKGGGTSAKAIIPGFPVCGSLWRTLRFHTGTVAFGSLLIAIAQFIRIVFAYLTKQLEKAPGNEKVKKIIACVINCMLACLEKCVKFISRNSYIYSAIKGTSFCWSAFKSFKLIFNNLARFGMTAGITAVLMLLAKCTVVAGSVIAGYIWLKYDPYYTSGEFAISNPVLPLIFMVVCSLMVAMSFFYVVELGIDTVLLNYCMDLERKEKGKTMAADMKLGAAPLGKAKDEAGAGNDDSEMDVSCCNACKCFNPCVKRCCVDEKKSGSTGTSASKVAPANMD
jgi:solute carrier family 44 (choline transporter-like protein), member 2/4/5